MPTESVYNTRDKAYKGASCGVSFFGGGKNLTKVIKLRRNRIFWNGVIPCDTVDARNAWIFQCFFPWQAKVRFHFFPFYTYNMPLAGCSWPGLATAMSSCHTVSQETSSHEKIVCVFVLQFMCMCLRHKGGHLRVFKKVPFVALSRKKTFCWKIVNPIVSAFSAAKDTYIAAEQGMLPNVCKYIFSLTVFNCSQYLPSNDLFGCYCPPCILRNLPLLWIFCMQSRLLQNPFLLAHRKKESNFSSMILICSAFFTCHTVCEESKSQRKGTGEINCNVRDLWMRLLEGDKARNVYTHQSQDVKIVEGKNVK